MIIYIKITAFQLTPLFSWRADYSCSRTDLVRTGSGRFSLPFPASLPQQKEDYTRVEGGGKGRGKEEREEGRESVRERGVEKRSIIKNCPPHSG